MKMFDRARTGAPYYYTKVSCVSCCAGPFMVRYSHGMKTQDLPCPRECGGRGLESRFSTRPDHHEIAQAETEHEVERALLSDQSVSQVEVLLSEMLDAEPDEIDVPEPDRRLGLYATKNNLNDCVIAAQKKADTSQGLVWVHMHQYQQECVVDDPIKMACFVVRPDPQRSAALR